MSAHVLVFPFPIQGHINPMLQFSKRLASKGLKVTIITTHSITKSLPPRPKSSLVQIRSISDGLKDGEKIEDFEVYLELFQRVVPQSLAQLIEEFKATSHPVKFIVYDCLITWVLDLACTFGIDAAPFFTQSAAVHSIHYHVYEGTLKLPIEGSLISMPSIPLLKIDEMPSLIVTPGCYFPINEININQSLNFHKASLLFFNTIDKLESQVLDWMRSQWPIKTIGPAIPSAYLDKRLQDDNEYGLSIFKPETDACLQWLEGKESGSVVYISMGSLVSLGEEQMEEIAKGIMKSKKHFLWVVRALEERKLPTDFKNDVSKIGLVVNWCPQLAVLAHRAIGCFVTHCGWNSTLEAISLGVPLLAMPQWTDQPTNAKYLADVWKIGVRLKVNDKGIVTRDELEACIRQVMDGECATDIKSMRQQFSGREEVVEVELEAGRGHHGSKSWIVKLSGFDSIDEARQLVGATFLVRDIDRPELEEGEYYSRDLVGMRVILKETGEEVGTVVNVFNSGGNDLLQVSTEASTETPDGSLKQKSEKYESGRLVWIPFVEAIVPDVDMDKREMHITPPKGLFELNVRSNEKSKKERRLIEWRERKKLQRRFNFAKKKLNELEQQHIFHGFQFGEKSHKNLLTEQIVRLNLNLLQQALQVQATEKPIDGCNIAEAMLDVTTWKCGKSLKISEKYLTSITTEKLDSFSGHRKTGTHLISEGKFASVVVLNSRYIEQYIESDNADFESDENPIISYLESLLSDKETFMQAQQRESVSIIFISPVVEIHLLEKLFAGHDYFGFNQEKVRFLEEEKIPVVRSSVEQKNKVLMKSPWEIHQSPIGFCGTISALASNNILEDLMKSGVDYIEVCSVSQRSLCGNPIFLGYVHSQETDIGLLTFEDNIELEDNYHIMLPMKSMQRMVKMVEKLPLNTISKAYSHVELINKEWVDIIPSTPNAYEFCCSLRSLLNACSMDNTCLMEVTK